MELESHPRCYVWTSRLIPAATVTWSAGCTDGLAQGTGTLTWKWANGEYEVSGILRAGKQHGHWVLRDANGTVAEGPYEDGEKTGRWIERFANGNLGEGPYVNGMAHGRWVFRLANGRVQELPYVDGKKHGRWIERYLNGQVNEGPWVDGKRHGRWGLSIPGWKYGNLNLRQRRATIAHLPAHESEEVVRGVVEVLSEFQVALVGQD